MHPLILSRFVYTGGQDYTGPSQSTLTFIPGQTVGAQRCTDVSVLDDNLIEDDEIFTLSLVVSPMDASAVMFVAGQNFTTITILQDPDDSKSFLLHVILQHLKGASATLICQRAWYTGTVKVQIACGC